MTTAYCYKINGALHPASEDAQEAIRKLPTGDTFKVKISRVRNPAFHGKFFAMMRFAFDIWEPQNVNVPAYLQASNPDKNFDRFRKDITILAGFYDTHIRLNGDIRVEAKSLAFGKMSEDEFEDVYNACLNVIIDKVCAQYTGDQLRAVLDTAEGFG